MDHQNIPPSNVPSAEAGRAGRQSADTRTDPRDARMAAADTSKPADDLSAREKVDRRNFAKQAIKAAERLKRLAGSLVVSLKFLCYVNALAGVWLWLLFFHTFLFSLSWWTLTFLPVFVALLLPSAILYRAVLTFGEILELPTRVRDHFKGTSSVDAGNGSRTPGEMEAAVEKPERRFRPLSTLKQFYRQYDFFSGLLDTSMFAVSLFNPFQKVLLLITAVVAIAQIVLAGLGLVGYLFFLLIF